MGIAEVLYQRTEAVDCEVDSARVRPGIWPIYRSGQVGAEALGL